MPEFPSRQLARALGDVAARPQRFAAGARARAQALALAGREALIAPRFCFRIRPRAQAPVSIAAAIAASAFAACACTLGDAFDARVRSLFRAGRRLLALELDLIGGELLFRLGRTARAIVRSEAARAGFGAGDALSPGNPGLALEHQGAVLALAGAEAHGIHLAGSGMLWPAKSITFLVPLGRGPGRHPARACSRCPSRERCRAR
jgi:hypothetical protein